MNNKIEVIGIDHGWSNMKTSSQVFTTGVKEITTEPALFDGVLEQRLFLFPVMSVSRCCMTIIILEMRTASISVSRKLRRWEQISRMICVTE